MLEPSRDCLIPLRHPRSIYLGLLWPLFWSVQRTKHGLCIPNGGHLGSRYMSLNWNLFTGTIINAAWWHIQVEHNGIWQKNTYHEITVSQMAKTHWPKRASWCWLEPELPTRKNTGPSRCLWRLPTVYPKRLFAETLRNDCVMFVCFVLFVCWSMRWSVCTSQVLYSEQCPSH